MSMFSKLNTEIKKQNIKERSEVLFKDSKEKRLFEQKLIFGDLLENLASLDIEAGYKVLSEEEEAAVTPEMIQKKQEEEAAQRTDEKIEKLDTEITKLKADQEAKKAALKTDVLSNTQQIQGKIDSLEQEKAELEQSKQK